MTSDHKNARQDGDMINCSHCGKAWDVNDPEPPKCTEGSAPKSQHRLAQLNRIRSRHGLK